jgi:hypothetical protein
MTYQKQTTCFRQIAEEGIIQATGSLFIAIATIGKPLAMAQTRSRVLDDNSPMIEEPDD